MASFGLLISTYILRLGQAAQKQQRPHCHYRKMYLEIRRADEWFLIPHAECRISIAECQVTMTPVNHRMIIMFWNIMQIMFVFAKILWWYDKVCSLETERRSSPLERRSRIVIVLSSALSLTQVSLFGLDRDLPKANIWTHRNETIIFLMRSRLAITSTGYEVLKCACCYPWNSAHMGMLA